MPPASPSIYLVVEDDAAAVERLREVVARLPVSAVLLRPRDRHSLSEATARAICAVAQAAGAAALVENDVALAARIAADGVHLTATPDLADTYRETRRVLGKQQIVGADPGASRHLAMELGEAGADYIAFSRSGAGEAQRDLVEWWSEVFEVPCVAMDVADATCAAVFIAAGADFVAFPVVDGIEREIGSVLDAGTHRVAAAARRAR